MNEGQCCECKVHDEMLSPTPFGNMCDECINTCLIETIKICVDDIPLGTFTFEATNGAIVAQIPTLEELENFLQYYPDWEVSYRGCGEEAEFDPEDPEILTQVYFDWLDRDERLAYTEWFPKQKWLAKKREEIDEKIQKLQKKRKFYS